MDGLALAGSFTIGAIISLLIISNPISTSAVFIALTEGTSRRKKMEILRRSIGYSTAILLFFSFTGMFLFQLFGISLGAFKIAGGILLFTTAITMMGQKHSKKHTELEYQDIAIIPLAVPFTAGPGTIVTAVVLMTEAVAFSATHGITASVLSVLGLYLAIAVVIVASYFTMAKSDLIHKHIKEGGRHVITRLMGLLVMAIAVQFVINGIIDIIPTVLQAI